MPSGEPLQGVICRASFCAFVEVVAQPCVPRHSCKTGGGRPLKQRYNRMPLGFCEVWIFKTAEGASGVVEGLEEWCGSFNSVGCQPIASSPGYFQLFNVAH